MEKKNEETISRRVLALVLIVPLAIILWLWDLLAGQIHNDPEG